MIDVFSVLQVVLRDAGLSVRLLSVDRMSVVSFEDEAIIGFACVFDNPNKLLENWKSVEMAVLRRYAPNLRVAGEKAWNVYCVFLSGGAADPIQDRQVRRVDEDLQRTRKIAACGIANREDLIRAILPILPLQFKPMLVPENVTRRLRGRLESIVPNAADFVLDESTPPTEVVPLLREKG